MELGPGNSTGHPGNAPNFSSSGSSSAKLGAKRKIRDGLSSFGAALSKGAGVFDFGPLKSVLDDIGGLMDVVERVTSCQNDCESLVNELDELLGDISAHLSKTTSPAVLSSLKDLEKGLRKEAEFLRDKRRTNMIGRVEEAMRKDSEVEECYRRIKVLLSRLSVSVSLAAADMALMSTQMNADVSMWRAADEESTDRLLRALPDAPAAIYCSKESSSLRRGRCTPNTRVELLEQLQAWACDDNAQKIYWLNGMAGTGKTTIAYSLCEWLQSVQKLGASFFCSQRLPECPDVNRIIPSISYRLSLFSTPFRHALSCVLADNKDPYNQVLRKQFETLFVAPLREVMRTLPANIVIVVDALDECDDQGGIGKVLKTLLLHARELPVKFFVTSRPESAIIDQMRKQAAEGVRLELRLHEIKNTIVQQDIATYLTAKLARAKLSDAELSILVERSGVLFIYAATVIRFIKFDSFSSSTERLKLVLDASATSTNESDETLDELYTAILQTGLELNGLTRSEKVRREMVLRHAVCAREPLSMGVMAGLLQTDNTVQVSAALRPLQSVLSVSERGVIGTLHESFPNYLLNPTRSGRFYCDPGQQHAHMAQRCFSLIKIPNPPFNICKLESSYLLDEEVPDIDQRVDKVVCDALLYACRFWAAHLEFADHIENCFQLLYEFLSERLLLWTEVMSLKRQMWEGVDMLRKVQTWCKGHAFSNDARLLVQDATRFATVVASGPVSRSTPHIYISTLAFWPKSGPVAKHYLPRFSGLVKIAGTATKNDQLAPVVLELNSGVWLDHFAFSSDGNHVAFIADDVAIWNIRTGRCEAGLGRTQVQFNSLAFSHDCLHVVLGCRSGAVYIWDMQTREMVGDPLRSHGTDSIWSVGCSPDGDHIATGSVDGIVRIWTRRTGQCIASILAHTRQVNSVAYSPDGAYIASGSCDGTIRIWNAYSTHMLEHALGGDTGPVHSVVFSPEGAHVASGTGSGAIHIWDARTGELVKNLLEAHVDSVRSVHFSPSGLHLVSGSQDGAVCIWDLFGGPIATQLFAYFIGDSILRVSYSPDGAQVLAFSELGTLYIWDSSVVELAGQACFDFSANVEKALPTDLGDTPAEFDAIDRVGCAGKIHAPRPADKSPEGHNDQALALAYSPDGAYIVSGSDDCTLRIWDAHTGRMVGQPLEGHTDGIESVSFSPDGTHIVSGSIDETICIWDVRAHAMFGAPLVGHTHRITSVSYSPDGAHIASGSWDKTVRIWDAYTGQTVGLPLIGHTDWVHSVSYSPGGAFLVSGSGDKTIRIWNTQTGRTVGDPLLGHTDRVESLAYSPDSLYIVSRSRDRTVCVWDAYTGSMIGHVKFDYDRLYSISYSSAGANLTLSYLHGAIHISHATHIDRDLVRPFRLRPPHISPMICVFSPSGMQIASSQPYGTIRVSSIHIGQVLDAEMRSQGDQPCAFEPCPCSICASHSDWGIWELDKDGWAITGNSRKLVWVPPYLHKSLRLPYNTVLISRHGALQIDFSGAKFGTSWPECYTARP
ncbi:hypothetical protein FRC12_011733 [Ceratobasidium sp. 428]|nr:hypothetical protein FRC12_011733 [Ceratobasidium sp. 428]